jgi:hypothetical protein
MDQYPSILHGILSGDDHDFLEDHHMMQLFRVSKSTLRNMRLKQGLPFFKCGRTVYYQKSKIIAWINSRSQGG